MDLIAYIQRNRKSFTYLGIGTSFRYYNFNQITEESDQVYPCFLKKYNNFRAIHYDPVFKENFNFLMDYFSNHGYIFIEHPSFWIWRTPDGINEFLIIHEELWTDKDFLFFKQLCDITIEQQNKLIVQLYAGRDLETIKMHLYSLYEGESKKYFKNNIMFDMTQGEASCVTNMKETFPLLDKDGNFLTFQFFTLEELLSLINTCDHIDTYIKKIYIKEFKRILNEHHTNYRRRLVGDTCLFESSKYDKVYGDPIVIFRVLKSELDSIVDLLCEIKSLSFNKKYYDELFYEHKQYQVHKWYSIVNSLLQNA